MSYLYANKTKQTNHSCVRKKSLSLSQVNNEQGINKALTKIKKGLKKLHSYIWKIWQVFAGIFFLFLSPVFFLDLFSRLLFRLLWILVLLI